MGNSLDTNDATVEQIDLSSATHSLSVSQQYRQMSGCFMFKIKKLKVSEPNLKRISNKYPDIDLSQLQLMLSFRGRTFILQTLKEDFHMLNQIKDEDDSFSGEGSQGSNSPGARKLKKKATRRRQSQQSINEIKDGRSKSISEKSVKLCYDSINSSSKIMSESQVQQDDIFQINCKNLIIGEEISFQLVSINLKGEENIDPDESVNKSVYEPLVLAQRKIQVQKLIQNNMLSMSVQLKATSQLDSKTANDNLTKSDIVAKNEKEAFKDKDKVGSLKLKISFMRGKQFDQNQLSKVLFTENEKKRQEEMTFKESSPPRNENQPFKIRHLSSSAPHKQEADPNSDNEQTDNENINLSNIAQDFKKVHKYSKTYERKKEDDSLDDESNEEDFGLQRTESETNFFDFHPSQKRELSTFFKQYKPVKEEVDQEDQSDETGEHDYDTDMPRVDRIRKRHTLVERYNDIRMPKSRVGHALLDRSQKPTKN